MSLYIVAAKKTTLKSPLAANSLSVVLKDFLDTDGNELAMASFGEWGTIVIKQGEVWELLRFTAIAQSSTDTSATLTIASDGRSLLPTTPYTGAATGQDFSAGAEVIVTNDPYIMSKFGNLENANTWNEIQTFATLPRTTAGDPVDDNDLVRKAYVLAAVLGTLTTINLIIPGTAGENVVAGNGIYFDTTDNEWKKWDADTATTVQNVLLGIAQGTGSDGVAITGGVLLQGVDTHQSGLVQGDVQYASNTAGGISTTPGTTETTVGIAKSATELYFSPRFDQVITEFQQDLLEAIAGGTDFYGVSAVGTDAYAITPSPSPVALVAGMKFRFKADVANTGAATLQVSAFSALAIKKKNDQDLVTGDIEAGQIVDVVYDGVNMQMQSQSAGTESAMNVQFFTTAGANTWTKPAGAKIVDVYLFGGAGGGGSGYSSTGGNDGRGGGGGGGGAFLYKRFHADALGATEAIVVGAGGAGGAGVPNSNSSNDGVAGVDSSFGTSLLVAKGGSFGAKGAGGVSGAGGAGGVVTIGEIGVAGGAGGAGSTAGATATAGTDSTQVVSPRGGGGGGGASSGADAIGGAGGGFSGSYVKAGGAGGTGGTGSGVAGTATAQEFLIGGVGSGGGAGESTSATCGSGAVGAFPGGGGGGGGGGGTGVSQTSGSGGAGAKGMVVVITHF